MPQNPSKEKEIATQRIHKLFYEAKQIFNTDSKLSDRYVHLARKIAMKFKVRIPPILKRKFCKHCYTYLVPSKNLRIRLHKSRVIYLCLKCKRFMRFPYKN